MKKKNTLKSLKQLDAKFVQGETKTLDYLMGSDGTSPYKTSDLHEYESYISELNSTDLQRHAEKVGLLPNCERRVLKERLIREFKRFVASRSSVSEKEIQSHLFVESNPSELSEESQKILRDGA